MATTTANATTATIDAEVWKALDLLHRRTRMPKKHLIRLLVSHFVNCDEGESICLSLGCSQEDLDKIRKSWNLVLIPAV